VAVVGGIRAQSWRRPAAARPPSALGAADVLDTSVDWAEGGISGQELLWPAGACDDVIRQVREQLERVPAQGNRSTPFGRRFEVEVPITGPTTPRMITNFLKVH
jgi:hypothetical protein